MRKFQRDEIRNIYRDYANHLEEAHPLLYEEYKSYLTRYAL